MNPLSGLASMNALVRGASGLVHEIKQPRLKSDDFAALLRTQLEKKPPTTPAVNTARDNAALMQTARLMKSRDADTDGLLTENEAGLARELFRKLDLDADGRLSQNEVKTGYLAAFSGSGPAMPIQEATQ